MSDLDDWLSNAVTTLTEARSVPNGLFSSNYFAHMTDLYNTNQLSIHQLYYVACNPLHIVGFLEGLVEDGSLSESDSSLYLLELVEILGDPRETETLLEQHQRGNYGT